MSALAGREPLVSGKVHEFCHLLDGEDRERRTGREALVLKEELGVPVEAQSVGERFGRGFHGPQRYQNYWRNRAEGAMPPVEFDDLSDDVQRTIAALEVKVEELEF